MRPTMTMSCREVLERLDDLVDGELSPTESEAAEAHLSGCEACREEARRLRALVAEAAALPRHVRPARDLWPGIAERIGAGRGLRRWLHGAPIPRGLALAAAAAGLVAATGAVTAYLTRPDSRPDTAALQAQLASGGTDADLAQAEADYFEATERLLAVVAQRRDAIPADAVKEMEDNIRTIDTALDQLRAGLRENPGNAQLTHLLASTHQKKLDLLVRLIKLSSQI
jgi:Putative zinc-finger